MSTNPPSAIEVFFAYAPKDEVFAEELGQHLDNLQRQGLIVGWYGRDISAPEEKAREIEFHLAQAAIVLLLVSSSFINSAYCYGAEMKLIMMRREESRNAWCDLNSISTSSLKDMLTPIWLHSLPQRMTQFSCSSVFEAYHVQ